MKGARSWVAETQTGEPRERAREPSERIEERALACVQSHVQSAGARGILILRNIHFALKYLNLASEFDYVPISSEIK